MYAIVRVGGKQYRVEKGDSLLVDRMRAEPGETVALEPLLFRDKDAVLDPGELGKVKVEAVVAGHERGKKLHVLKFKPKRGYKRRTGHRSELTRLEVRELKMLSRRPAARKSEAADGDRAEAPKGSATGRKKSAGGAKGAAGAARGSRGGAKGSGGADKDSGGAAKGSGGAAKGSGGGAKRSGGRGKEAGDGS
jgi:large subunit ribosomal protein L21